MSPASYLTAPPRVAAGSIARARYDRDVSEVLWAAVAFCLLAVTATFAGLAVLAIRGWRQFKALRRGLLAALGELTASLGAVEQRLGVLEARSAELQRALERLSRSLAQARVLARAAGEVGELAGRVRGVVPTK
jgi:uncharacterized coiled-coil protein SlyX